MRNLEELIQLIKTDHEPRGPALQSIRERVIKSVPLPTDMIAFYEVLGEGAVLFDETYDILSMDDLARPEFLPEELSVNWYKFCDVGEGNCVAFDADSIRDDKCNIIEVFHETAGERGYSKIIAKSFTEFLERALDAGDCFYWLRWRFKGYGDAFDKKGPSNKKPWWKVW